MTRYNSKLGIYREGCGIENVIMSWGHDEYLYHVSFRHNVRHLLKLTFCRFW